LLARPKLRLASQF